MNVTASTVLKICFVLGCWFCDRESNTVSIAVQVGQFMNTQTQEKGLANDTTAEVREEVAMVLTSEVYLTSGATSSNRPAVSHGSGGLHDNAGGGHLITEDSGVHHSIGV